MSMTQSRRALRMCAATFALLGMTTSVWARESCAQPRDVVALKTAAMQQELMVAALSCHETHLYNRFVTGYQTDLQRSDAVLRGYFTHHGGIAAYHAYKTRLANAASLRSLHDIEGYCSSARATFHDALDEDGVTLANLVADRPAAGVAACRGRMRVAERPE